MAGKKEEGSYQNVSAEKWKTLKVLKYCFFFAVGSKLLADFRFPCGRVGGGRRGGGIGTEPREKRGMIVFSDIRTWSLKDQV